MAVVYRNNFEIFRSQWQKNRFLAHQEMGRLGLVGIQEETPDRTGKLKGDTRVSSDESGAEFLNTMPYATYVHQGTYKMNANPFMVRGFRKKIPEIIGRLIQLLRV